MKQHVQGGRKTGLFLRVDNFATVNRRKTCDWYVAKLSKTDCFWTTLYVNEVMRLDAEFIVEEAVELGGLVSQYDYLGFELDVLLLQTGGAYRRLSLLESTCVARSLGRLVVLTTSFDVRVVHIHVLLVVSHHWWLLPLNAAAAAAAVLTTVLAGSLRRQCRQRWTGRRTCRDMEHWRLVGHCRCHTHGTRRRRDVPPPPQPPTPTAVRARRRRASSRRRESVGCLFVAAAEAGVQLSECDVTAMRWWGCTERRRQRDARRRRWMMLRSRLLQRQIKHVVSNGPHLTCTHTVTIYSTIYNKRA